MLFDKLDDWSKRPEPGIRYYSGTAVYRARSLPCAAAGPQAAGVPRSGRSGRDGRCEAQRSRAWASSGSRPSAWRSADGDQKPGDNTSTSAWSNLWINRLIGDEQLPEDSDRNANGTLKSWPAWLTEGKSSPTGRYTFGSWRLWKKGDPLVESGLLGPVTLQACRVGACTHAVGATSNHVRARTNATEVSEVELRACKHAPYEISEDEQFIRIETSQIAAAICKKGYVSGSRSSHSSTRRPAFTIRASAWTSSIGSWSRAAMRRIAPAWTRN